MERFMFIVAIVTSLLSCKTVETVKRQETSSSDSVRISSIKKYVDSLSVANSTEIDKLRLSFSKMYSQLSSVQTNLESVQNKTVEEKTYYENGNVQSEKKVVDSKHDVTRISEINQIREEQQLLKEKLDSVVYSNTLKFQAYQQKLDSAETHVKKVEFEETKTKRINTTLLSLILVFISGAIVFQIISYKLKSK